METCRQCSIMGCTNSVCSNHGRLCTEHQIEALKERNRKGGQSAGKSSTRVIRLILTVRSRSPGK